MKVKTGKYYYIYLSGEHRTLPEAEVRAIAEAEGIPLRTALKLDQILIIASSDELINYIARRASLIKVAGKLLGISNVIDGIKGIINVLKSIEFNKKYRYFFNFTRVKEFGKNNIIYSELVHHLKSKFGILPLSLIKKYHGRESLIIDIIASNLVVIGVRLYTRSIKLFEDRAPQKRPEYRPGTLPPVISRLFVNLSRVSTKRKSLLLDPFCGVGGFLIEACVIGVNNYVGIDINHEFVSAARKNLLHYNCMDNVVVGDACRIPISFNRVDAIATDPPYGRLTKPVGKALSELMRCFLEEASKMVRKGSYIVFAQRRGVIDEREIEEKYNLRIIEKHVNWVHGSLTRDIYVVKRI